METVFDHNLTSDEIEQLGFLASFSLGIRHGLEFPDPLTKETYLATITQDAAIFDLYLLFSYRINLRAANWYAALIPVQVQEYKLGFDYLMIPIYILHRPIADY